MKDEKLYDRPVRLQYLRMRHTVRVFNSHSGGSEEFDYLQADRGFAIELHLRQRIIRVWCTRIAKARVVTLSLSDGMSWEVEGDVESCVQPAPEGPSAA